MKRERRRLSENYYNYTYYTREKVGKTFSLRVFNEQTEVIMMKKRPSALHSLFSS